jgi:hypothetical protein
LFHKDNTTRIEARNIFLAHIDNVISASYGPDLYISHRCVNKDQNTELKINIANNLLKDNKECDFRCARHKELGNEVKGNIMYCPECGQSISTVNIVNNSLKRWRDTFILNNRAQHNRTDTNIPLFTCKVGHGCIHFFVPHE